MQKLISIGELAASVGLHINTLRKLADANEIPSVRTKGGQRRFELAQVERALESRGKKRKQKIRPAQTQERPSRIWHKELSLIGLDEAQVWQEIRTDLALDLTQACADTIPYAFNEMLNNAIDHSNGNLIDITFIESDTDWEFKIKDDGIGAFANLVEKFKLDNKLEAIAELTKGKRTTAPSAHSGEGIFFTSKAVDSFQIHANGSSWSVDNLKQDFSVGGSDVQTGTLVICKLSRNTKRKLIEVFRLFTKDLEFSKTKPTVKLFETGMTFLSRSEGRRLMVGLDEFKEVYLDFSKVSQVGQGFVDEVFRIWAQSHPDTKLIPTNMSSEVEFMVLRGIKKD